MPHFQFSPVLDSFSSFVFFACSHKDSLSKLLFLSKFDEKRNGFSTFLFPSLLYCFSLASFLLQSCFSLASVLLQSCFSLAAVLLQSCFSLVPRLKLVFRGSYFLLLIGSPRPPRKRVPQGSSGSYRPYLRGALFGLLKPGRGFLSLDRALTGL